MKSKKSTGETKARVRHTPEIENKVIEHVASGGILRDLLGKGDPALPDERTWCDWVRRSEFNGEYPELAQRYARAKVLRIEHLLEKMLADIYDNKRDLLPGPNGSPIANHAAIQRHRLQVDTLKFIAAKLVPHIYGDKVDVNINANVQYVISASPLSEQEFIEQYTTGVIDVDESGEH